jgi:hypothetical protein
VLLACLSTFFPENPLSSTLDNPGMFFALILPKGLYFLNPGKKRAHKSKNVFRRQYGTH